MKRIVTQSELSTFKLCRFKHYLKYEKGFSHTGKGISALAGNAGHKGLELYYSNKDFATIKKAIAKQFNDYRQEYVGDFLFVYNKWEAARLMMPEVVNHYSVHCATDFMRPARFPKLPILKDPIIEFEFQIPIITNGGKQSQFFDLAGKIDLIGDCDDGLWVVDHKFKVAFDDSLQDSLRNSLQMKVYVLAMRAHFGIPVKGACLNIIKRKAPGYPKINKNGTLSLYKVDTTIDRYMEVFNKQDRWLRDNGKPGLDIVKYQDEIDRVRRIKWFARYFCEYSDEELMEIQREIYTLTMEIRRCQALGPWSFFKNDLACNIFGKCTYFSICNGGEVDERFSCNKDPHSELETEKLIRMVGEGFVIDDQLISNEPTSFDGMIDSVM